MALTSFEISKLQAFYDYNRIPLWVLNKNKELENSFFPDTLADLKEILSAHITRLILKIPNPDFDILHFENELYYVFSFVCNNETFYLLGGPMLLSNLYNLPAMRSLSFATDIGSVKLNSLVEILPVVSFTSFCSCLQLMMLSFRKDSLSLADISNYKFSSLQNSLNCTVTHEIFENNENYRIHTPYSHEVAVLNCVREGNVERLASTYRTLPQIKYGIMSANPLRQLFYGCIANTTLITRYAIEGGLDEETAFTLSDVYIKQMENCSTLFELNILNEKMALDFTERVAKVKALQQHIYIKPISKCVDYISRNINNRITLNTLAKVANLTPKYLSNLFCKEVGQTLNSFIEDKKINEAKNLLAYSQYSYNSISSYLSFCSHSYFISVFKKKVGMTPKEYRRKYSNQAGK